MKIEIDLQLPVTGIGKVDSAVAATAKQLKENIAEALKGISDISEISNVASRLFSFDDMVIVYRDDKMTHKYVVKSVSTILMNEARGEGKIIRCYKYFIDHTRESRAVGIPPVDRFGHHSTAGGHTRD